jgi:hypothetical protein
MMWTLIVSNRLSTVCSTRIWKHIIYHDHFLDIFLINKKKRFNHFVNVEKNPN